MTTPTVPITPTENRELAWTAGLLVEAMRTGNEVHLVITKGLTAEDGSYPVIVGARYDFPRNQVVLEFDRPVPDQLFFQSVPPL